MKTYCESRSNQKYAANSRRADHAGEWQRFYLLFCCKKSGCARRFPVFSSTSEMMTPHQGFINKDGIHDNIQLSWKHQRAVAGKPNNDPSWSSPHVECTTTVSLRTSYRNAYQPIRALIRNDQKCKCRSPNLHQNKTRGCPPLGRNPLAKRWPIARLRFSFWTS